VLAIRALWPFPRRPRTPAQDEPEALIPEARGHQRRRQLLGSEWPAAGSGPVDAEAERGDDDDYADTARRTRPCHPAGTPAETLAHCKRSGEGVVCAATVSVRAPHAVRAVTPRTSGRTRIRTFYTAGRPREVLTRRQRAGLGERSGCTHDRRTLCWCIVSVLRSSSLSQLLRPPAAPVPLSRSTAA
jgi:hypothetical protein